MDVGNTIKKKIGQAFFGKFVRLGGTILFSVATLNGCTFFDADTGPASPETPSENAESTPSTSGTPSLLIENGSPVAVKPLEDPKKLTDVTLELTLPPEMPVENLIFHFGKSPDTLTNSKKVSKGALVEVDPTTHRYRYILKDIGELKPLFVSITTEAGGLTSEPSQPFEVKD